MAALYDGGCFDGRRCRQTGPVSAGHGPRVGKTGKDQAARDQVVDHIRAAAAAFAGWRGGHVHGLYRFNVFAGARGCTDRSRVEPGLCLL